MNKILFRNDLSMVLDIVVASFVDKMGTLP